MSAAALTGKDGAMGAKDDRSAAAGERETARLGLLLTLPAQLLVLFNTANAYLDLRYRERLMALRRDELRSRRETLALIRRMADGGAATRLEITRSAARVAEIEAQLPGLEAAIAAKRNEIAVLVGTAPGGVETGRGGSIPRPTLSPEVGIPADLLRNRPDILAAERRYYAALADLGAAEAARYPRLSLSGAISITAIRAGRDLTQAHLGPLVQLPAIPGTATEAAVGARRAAVTAGSPGSIRSGACTTDSRAGS